MTVAVVSFLLSYSAQKQYANKGRYEVQKTKPTASLYNCRCDCN